MAAVSSTVEYRRNTVETTSQVFDTNLPSNSLNEDAKDRRCLEQQCMKKKMELYQTHRS